MNHDKTNELREAGWERRFVTDLSRVEEWVKLYTETGFGVKVTAYEADEALRCDVCVSADSSRMRVIYTRKTHEAGDIVNEAEERYGP